jgi:hypothetical protein
MVHQYDNKNLLYSQEFVACGHRKAFLLSTVRPETIQQPTEIFTPFSVGATGVRQG